MENKLISMVDFVLTDKYTETGHKNYANFLKQPLELWMFVPCKLVNGFWVGLEEPKLAYEKEDIMGVYNGIFQNHNEYLNEYQEAKDRVLFEGFECIRMTGYHTLVFPMSTYTKDFTVFEDAFNNQTIEDLVKYNLERTPTALKQIGL